MDDLFEEKFKENLKRKAPLADKMRPLDFEGFFGQEELVGETSPLKRIIQEDKLTSLILWGPPGSGKTTLARIIAEKTKSYFVKLSAVNAKVADVREIVKQAKERLKLYNKETILFMDEIHRFTKAQQDTFLPFVEDGTITLIGATTENPSFYVISPLLSRSAVYVLKSLDDKAMEKVLIRALTNKENGLGNFEMKITRKGLNRLINFADGDARAGLNGLEFVVNYLVSHKQNKIDEKNVSEILKEHALRYDKKGDEHYNIISAFIKSMRDSDPNGALYWLARMVESGEDPRFIARRMIIFASEDISNANPEALGLAISVAQAVDYVGFPEAQINLAHGVTYLATSPKSNASYMALLKAKEDAQKGSFGVPLHLRNAVTKLMKSLNYGKDYKYAHDFKDSKVDQTHFPKEIGEQKYYD
ncbi:MAG: replication-associated recombination protein A [Patescibacteria group bacterium]